MIQEKATEKGVRMYRKKKILKEGETDTIPIFVEEVEFYYSNPTQQVLRSLVILAGERPIGRMAFCNII